MPPLARPILTPRYGSPAEVAAFLGVRTKTVRRAIAELAIPSFRVGRRVLISFREAEPFLRRASAVATVARKDAQPFIPIYSDAERKRRNEATRKLLTSLVTEGDTNDQRETLAVLHEALGPKRSLSPNRPLFP